MHLFLTAPVLAAYVAARPDPSAIVDGQVAENCGWPSVVRMETPAGAAPCSGTLVHPYIVATAAHCVFYWDFARVVFGESDDAASFSTPIEFCEKNPDFPIDATTEAQWDNTDYAFCKLAQPVENVPIIPIAYGCELDAVEPGAEITVVGFGITQTMATDVGTKRFGDTVLTELDAGELVVESISCGGDSGGGYFMQLPGGELRQVGITSYG
ncbi:MAG: S1 family peptidase, partial [Deltaproteobacteria bacterium]|nr:S1 family peptidase [Nannocystaceae bacterium]